MLNILNVHCGQSCLAFLQMGKEELKSRAQCEHSWTVSTPWCEPCLWGPGQHCLQGGGRAMLVVKAAQQW